MPDDPKVDVQKSTSAGSSTTAPANIPTSGFTGKVDVVTDGGKAEATLLAAKSVCEAANRVADRITDALNSKPHAKVFIFMGVDTPHFEQLQLFRLKIRLFKEGLASSAKRLDEVAKAAFEQAAKAAAAEAVEPKDDEALRLSPPLPPVPVAVAQVLPGIPAMALPVALGLDAVSKVFSFFQSDYTLGGIAVSADDTVLAAAIAEELTKKNKNLSVFLARHAAPAIDDAGVNAMLSDCAELATQGQLRIPVLNAWSAAARATTPTNAANAIETPQAADAAIACDAAAAAWQTLTQAYGALITGLTALDSTGVSTLSLVMQQAAISEQYGKDTYLLFVQLDAAVGGYLVKRNLWTFLTGIPVKVMGGAVVNFVLLDGEDGCILAAGARIKSTPYKRLMDIHAFLND